MTDLGFDPLGTGTLSDPYPFYRALRERAPVEQVRRGGYYLVSRYEDVRKVALDVETFSSKFVAVLLQGAGGEVALMPRPSEGFGPPDVLAVQDPPRHGPQRKRMTQCLGRESVEAMAPSIAARAHALVDALLADGGGDFMARVAFRLPVAVTLDLLGFPEGDAAWVKEHSDCAVELLSGAVTPERLGVLAGEALALHAYAVDRWSEIARGDRATTPLTAQLLEAKRAQEVDDGEAASICMQLLIAGSDSTASLVGSALRVLAERPELAATIRADLSLLPAFVEEILRLESPFQGHFRVAMREVELAGVRLPAGAALMLLWGSANRDPGVFEDPDEIRLDRENGRLHLAFGQGIHLCVGAQLARRQARLVLARVLEGTRSIELAVPTLVYRPSTFVRTLDSLPVTLGA